MLAITEYIYFLLNFLKYHIRYDWVFRLMTFNKWLKKSGRNVLRLDKILEPKSSHSLIKYIQISVTCLYRSGQFQFNNAQSIIHDVIQNKNKKSQRYAHCTIRKQEIRYK